jgi:hypothetical protein
MLNRQGPVLAPRGNNQEQIIRARQAGAFPHHQGGSQDAHAVGLARQRDKPTLSGAFLWLRKPLICKGLEVMKRVC